MTSGNEGNPSEQPAATPTGQAAQTIALDEDVLRANHVVVKYPNGFCAVNDISFRIPSASIIGVVGESGSGKTSLALAVTGLIPSHSGELMFLGKDLLKTSRDEIRRVRADVQLVFQNPHASLELRKIRPDRTAWIDDEALMERVHLDPILLSRYPHQLSGGQAQRVCIARALLFRPRLIVADEPSSGLDVSVQALILQLLLELRDQEKLSILFISHDLSVVRRMCSYTYVMRGGEVVEEGETERLFDHPEHDYTKQLLAAVPGRERHTEVDHG
jgi:ABC-type oligopeptide transport system ATPase subunit